VSHRNAYILLSLVALLWAGNFPASKIGLSELGPLARTTARAATAVIADVVLTTKR
jgi:drug/metabolite transporter (DMT)-like permease